MTELWQSYQYLPNPGRYWPGQTGLDWSKRIPPKKFGSQKSDYEWGDSGKGFNFKFRFRFGFSIGERPEGEPDRLQAKQGKAMQA
jgi:hypothetical protein